MPILVVDDDSAIREFVEMALRDEGYDVMVANDGLVALNIVKQSQVHLILLDMRMPVMDGWAFLNAYQQQVPVPRAPVIAFSANNRAISETTGDVVEFIPKPFDLNKLLDDVKKHAFS